MKKSLILSGLCLLSTHLVAGTANVDCTLQKFDKHTITTTTQTSINGGDPTSNSVVTVKYEPTSDGLQTFRLTNASAGNWGSVTEKKGILIHDDYFDMAITLKSKNSRAAITALSFTNRGTQQTVVYENPGASYHDIDYNVSDFNKSASLVIVESGDVSTDYDDHKYKLTCSIN